MADAYIEHLARQVGDREVRLVIFGDSWCRADAQTRTWPELLGEHLGWATINVALPGSGAGTLELQARLLAAVLAKTGRQLHPDCWALVHTGGNDVLQAGPANILRAVLRALCGCCYCLPPCSGALWMLDEVCNRVHDLAVRLHEPPFGVRNMLFVGMPLCNQMPVVQKYLEFLVGVSSLLQGLGRLAVRRLNVLHLERLRALRKRLGPTLSVVTLDEAAAIEAVHEAAAEARKGKGVSTVSTGATSDPTASRGAAYEDRSKRLVDSADGQEKGEDEEELVDELGLWVDMVHPTQHHHWDLSLVMLEHFQKARNVDGSMPVDASRMRVQPQPASGSAGDDGSGSEGNASDVTARLI